MFYATKTERAGIHLRKEGKRTIQITGRFQMEDLCSALLGSACVPWRHSEFMSVLCGQVCALCPHYIDFLGKSQRRGKESDREGIFFFNWSLKPVTFGCSPKTMILALAHHAVLHEKHCFT